MWHVRCFPINFPDPSAIRSFTIDCSACSTILHGDPALGHLTGITQFHWPYNHCIRELMSPQLQFFARIIASILIRQPTCSRAGGIWFISQSWFNAIPTIPDAHTLRHGGSCKLQPYHQHQPCKCCSLVIIIIIIICRRTEWERQERSDEFPQTSSSS